MTFTFYTLKINGKNKIRKIQIRVKKGNVGSKSQE
jgi:hypothetical protein